jgi:hypothetical protein
MAQKKTAGLPPNTNELTWPRFEIGTKGINGQRQEFLTGKVDAPWCSLIFAKVGGYTS